MRSAIIKIHMPCITVQFEAIDGNLKHLMNIYSNYFMQV